MGSVNGVGEDLLDKGEEIGLKGTVVDGELEVGLRFGRSGGGVEFDDGRVAAGLGKGAVGFVAFVGRERVTEDDEIDLGLLEGLEELVGIGDGDDVVSALAQDGGTRLEQELISRNREDGFGNHGKLVARAYQNG